MLQHMPSGVDKRRFTADEYQAMGRAGILRNTDRVELIEGEILEMAPTSASRSPTSCCSAGATISTAPPIRDLETFCW